MVTPIARGLPDFPWDRLTPHSNVAKQHPDGIVDLSIGTPVDDTPAVITRALELASNAPGYPTAAGLPELRLAWTQWANQVTGAALDEDQVAPLIGSKELVAWLPIVFGVRPGDVVALPELAYPTYAVGALMAGATPVTYTDPADIPSNAKLIWMNTPSNPTGEVLDAQQIQSVVEVGRTLGAPVVSDECYIELGWEREPVSVLTVAGSDMSGVLSVQSLSKRSNLAGYRSGAVLGDRQLIADIVSLRKHAGMLLPTPIQRASIAALGDSEHVAQQKERYRHRRHVLRDAFKGAGFEISHSEAGLYLWATRGEPCMQTVEWLARRGILVAPGDFYGPAGAHHVRLAFTATDERVASVTSRLS